MITRILTWLAVLAAIALVVGAIVKGYEHWRDAVRAEGDKAGAARVQNQWDEDRASQQAQAIEDARQSAKETLRRMNKQQENQHVQDTLLAKVRRDAAGAAAAVGGLRLRATAYLDAAGCGTVASDSALECIRKAAGQIGDVLGRCAARHQQLAADADDARTRGLKCEADYDALTLRPAAVL